MHNPNDIPALFPGVFDDDDDLPEDGQPVYADDGDDLTPGTLVVVPPPQSRRVEET
jgi:hypothetical protein